MSASILSRPVKSGCNWNAFGNPVIFVLRRQDHTITQVNDSGGFAQIQINGIDLTAYYQVGNSVALLGNSVAVVELYGMVTLSAFSGGNTLITTDLSYAAVIADPDNFINNLSKRTDYRIEYNFKSIAGVELLASNLATSPSADGAMRLNASLLKNLLSATWTLPVALNEVDSTGSIEFYLSYQEYYDGVLQGSVTNDSGNPIQGLLGANQIGSADGSNMLAYFLGSSTKKFLTRFQLNSVLKGLKMWRDWPFTLSFIWPSSFTDIFYDITQYDSGGSLLSTTSGSLVNTHAGKLNRLKLSSGVNTSAKRMDVALKAGIVATTTLVNSTAFNVGWTNVDYFGGPAWTLGATDMSVSISSITGPSDLATSPAFSAVGANAVMQGNITYNVQAGTSANLYILASNGATLELLIMQPIVGTGLDVNLIIPGHTMVQGGNTNIVVQFEWVLGGVGTHTIKDIFIEAVPLALAETISIEVDDACEYNEYNLPIPWKNPILLQWKNSLGGDAFWMFPMSHDYNYEYRNGVKARRITLYDNNLTPVQWEAINELNSGRAVYKPSIIDLENTNTINATSKMVGQQVYMVAKDGSKTGVIVIPSSDRVVVRRVRHAIAIEIELPETIEV